MDPEFRYSFHENFAFAYCFWKIPNEEPLLVPENMKIPCQWCREMFGKETLVDHPSPPRGAWHCYRWQIFFAHEEDAALFKLRFACR